jgi:FAD/FMN-containing dehydrogenase
MDRIEPVDVASGTITCEAGARWREVVAAASAQGFVPPVLPLYLDLTVGGTISVGGIGPTVHQFGPLLANVKELEVVTGAGERARCGWTQERPLFDATLGNLGRCAVITRATLALRRIKPLVRTFYLLYDDVSTWLADQQQLAQSGRCEYLDGFCTASVQGMRNTPAGRRPFAQWFYALHVGIEYEPGNAPEAATVLAGLRPYRVVHTEDNETARFPLRFDPRFESMIRMGAFEQAHPVFECLLPVSVLKDMVPKLLEALPLSIGDGHRVYRVANRDLPRFFVAAEEADAHPAYVQKLIEARAKDTVVTEAFHVMWPNAPHRVLRSCVEAATAFQGDITGELAMNGKRMPLPRWSVPCPTRETTGAIEAMVLYAGESTSMVKSIQPAAAIVKELAEGAEHHLNQWATRLGATGTR